MSLDVDTQSLVGIRRDLHEHPEPGWCEFRTTAVIAERLRRLGFEVHVGPDAVELTGEERFPGEETIDRRAERAIEEGVDPDLVDRLRAGGTGVVGVLERGDGPVVGLRTDIDALDIHEAEDEDHRPAREGFRSEHAGESHACGHDGHAAIGLGVAETVAADESFDGTLKLLFQPGEEGWGGGRAMAASGHLDDVDSLLAVHLGLDLPTGTVVTGADFLTVSGFEVEFSGTSAHSAAAPHEGKNALLAASTAVQNLYAIPRHSDGETRINVGTLEAGTASNVVPGSATMSVESRGRTDELCAYVEDRMESALRGAAESHGVDVSITKRGTTISADHDPAVAGRIADAIADVEGVTDVRTHLAVPGSEDACYLIERVREHGGDGTYLLVGADLASGHHTPRFDFDENALGIAVRTLSRALAAEAAG